MTCFLVRRYILVCVCECVFTAACGQSVVAAVGGTAGRLITESEGTSHPPPLFLPDPKAEKGLLRHTHTHKGSANNCTPMHVSVQ